MEGLLHDPALATALAVGVGGVALFVGNRLLRAEEEEAAPLQTQTQTEDAQPSAPKPKGKNKKKKKKAKADPQPQQADTAAAAAKPAQEAPQKATPKAPVEAKANGEAKQQQQAQKAPEKAPEKPPQKAPKPAPKEAKPEPKEATPEPKEDQTEPKEAGEASVSKSKKKRNRKKKSKTAGAGDSLDADASAETIWQTVPSRRQKKKPAPPAAEEVAVADDGKASVQIEIGEYAPKLIGPGGQTIQGLQDSTGAKVDLDRATQMCTISGSADQVKAAQDFIMNLLANQKKDFLDLGAKRGLVFAKIREIQDTSGARLDLERDSSVLELSGEVANVQKARDMITEILNAASVDTIDLALRDVPCVIGKSGANVRAIQSESGATLDIDSDIGVVTLTGTPDQVARANQLVRLYVEHRGPPPEAVKKLQMPNQDARLVIGQAGANVQRLERDTGARIKIDLNDGGQSSVTVSGSTSEVEAAVSAVNKLIADHSNEATVPIANSSIFKALLGSGGATINGIRETSRARVELSDAAVTIKGTSDQVAKAREMVEDVIQAEIGPPKVPAGQSMFEIDLGGATGRIIGGGGSNIARLQEEHGVTISIKRSTYCYVVGPPEGVEAAKAEIEDTMRRHEEAQAKAKLREEEAARLAAEQAAKAAAEAEAAEAEAADATEANGADAAAEAPVAPVQQQQQQPSAPSAASVAAAPKPAAAAPQPQRAVQNVVKPDNQAWQPPTSTWGANDAWGASTTNGGANGAQNGGW